MKLFGRREERTEVIVPEAVDFHRLEARSAVRHQDLPVRWQPSFMAAAPGRRDFKGAEVSRLTLDWMPHRRPVDEEVRMSMSRLRARCRDLARNNGYCRQYLRLLMNNVIGHAGMKMQAKVRQQNGELAKETNRKIEAAWKDWATHKVTVDGRLNLVAAERLLLRTEAVDGEFLIRKFRGFARNRYGFALQLIDPDLLDEALNQAGDPERGINEIRMGIEVDVLGAPVAYHLWDRPQSPYGWRGRNRYRVPAEEIIHHFVPDRVNQTRGLTWLQAGMFSVRMLDAYDEAELVAARLAASKIGFLVTKSGMEIGEVNAGDPKAPLEFEGNPGSLEELPPGMEFQSWDPEHPTTAYPDFQRAQLRRIAVAWGVSYNALASDLERVNYSSMRSGILIERDDWKALQQMWIDDVRQDLYDEWLNMALLSGALSLGSRNASLYNMVTWTPKRWPWVDPLKDGQAAVIGVQNGMGSRTDALAEQGRDYEEIIEQLAEEERMAREAGVSINGGPKPTVEVKDEDEDEDEESGKSGSQNGRGRLARGVNGMEVLS